MGDLGSWTKTRVQRDEAALGFQEMCWTEQRGEMDGTDTFLQVDPHGNWVRKTDILDLGLHISEWTL